MTLISYDEAIGLVLRKASALSTDERPLDLASGRFLAAPVSSPIYLPRFDNSQMDGYAVVSSDLSDASVENPVTLPLAGVYAAGGTDLSTLVPGTTGKIFTGAQMPPGADAVIPLEDVTLTNEGQAISFVEPATQGQFVRLTGEDVEYKQLLLHDGDELTAGRMALLASVGWGKVSVYRAARVAILTNGDELVSQSVHPQDLRSGQIYESNGIMLQKLVRSSGAEVVATLNLADSKTEIVNKLNNIVETLRPDVIISSGGVSVGERDYIRSAIKEIGEVVFWRAAIRPGKPILYATIGGTHFLGLPGNPASTMVTFELFVRPLLAKLHGDRTPLRFFKSILAEDLKHGVGRRSFMRAFTSLTDHGLVSRLSGGQASHFVSTLAEANSLVVVPENLDTLVAGSRVNCLLIGQLVGD